jgi:hypothetical protein
MSKRKRRRPAKARSSSKVRPKAARSAEHKGRANSKQARALGLLRRPGGATIAASARVRLHPTNNLRAHGSNWSLIHGLGFSRLQVRHSPPKRSRNALAVELSGK